MRPTIKHTLLAVLIVLAGCTKPDVLAQNPKTSFTIAITGDSHVLNAWPIVGGYDSIWWARMKLDYQRYYDTVKVIVMPLAGGRTIGSCMPGWYTYPVNYGNSEPVYSIDTILKQNPDLIIICATGNHTVNHMPANEAIYCFKYLIDTMRSLGKSFLITGQAPRQKTFTNGMTLASYYDSSIKINNAIRAHAPKSYVDLYSTMEDTLFGKRPWPVVLSSDSLHWSNYGNTLFYKAHMNNFTVDSTLTDFAGRYLNVSLKKAGGNVELSGRFGFRKIELFGTNDQQNFISLHTTISTSPAISDQTLVISDVSYLWYKAVITTGRKISSLIRKIN